MKKSVIKSKTDPSLIAKAGLWYTICNFVFKGMVFFTVPIFTRVLSKKELGKFSNYSSIILVVLVLTSLDLYTSIIRSKVEHEEDIDSYILSILSFSTLFTVGIYAVCFFYKASIEQLIGLEFKYINLMFLYCLFAPAYTMYITKQRAFYKYKKFVLFTAITTVTSTLLSLFLVINMKDKLWGRSIGQYLPSIIMGIILFIVIIKNGHRINIKYWKYALFICVPLVPHTLSVTLLSASDRFLITKISGPEITAIYSVAGSCYSIVAVLMNSMNTAWTPWLFDNLKINNYDGIKEISKKYIIFFWFCAFGIMLIGPELILFFGGNKYMEAVYCLNPLITSTVIQFIYLFYVNIEFYTKKTVGVSIATFISAIINIILNYIFINLFKENGHIVAAYTTLIGYIVLLYSHYTITKILKMDHVLDNKFFFKLSSFSLIISIFTNFLYTYSLLRYPVLIVYLVFFVYMVIKNKDKILRFFVKKRTR
ncbi:oligosaccharide flippase family protein [Lagierella sp.]|uniref:oligosaccharide flippase family protein n=1 Tax=Lagierella sp. TaxID=2849657 RepID=UPI0026084350|nr:oligosaccharide flippase family protein [Lagierella sp.]